MLGPCLLLVYAALLCFSSPTDAAVVRTLERTDRQATWQDVQDARDYISAIKQEINTCMTRLAYEKCKASYAQQYCDCMANYNNAVYCSCIMQYPTSQVYCQCIGTYGTKNATYCSCVNQYGLQYAEYCSCVNSNNQTYCNCLGQYGSQYTQYCGCVSQYGLAYSGYCSCVSQYGQIYAQYCACAAYYGTAYCNCVAQYGQLACASMIGGGGGWEWDDRRRHVSRDRRDSGGSSSLESDLPDFGNDSAFTDFGNGTWLKELNVGVPMDSNVSLPQGLMKADDGGEDAFVVRYRRQTSQTVYDSLVIEANALWLNLSSCQQQLSQYVATSTYPPLDEITAAPTTAAPTTAAPTTAAPTTAAPTTAAPTTAAPPTAAPPTAAPTTAAPTTAAPTTAALTTAAPLPGPNVPNPGDFDIESGFSVPPPNGRKRSN